MGNEIARIGGVPIYRDSERLSYVAGLAIDADGAPTAYAPSGAGLAPLDHLANAGKPGNWWGVAVGPDGEPVIQGPTDPAPGYYVSTTALADPMRKRTDPRRYVDSSTVAYVAVPKELLALGVKMGQSARVSYHGRTAGAIVADVGPRGKIGEGSIALARQLGIDPSPRTGGVQSGVGVVIDLTSPAGWSGFHARRLLLHPRTAGKIGLMLLGVLAVAGLLYLIGTARR